MRNIAVMDIAATHSWRPSRWSVGAASPLAPISEQGNNRCQIYRSCIGERWPLAAPAPGRQHAAVSTPSTSCWRADAASEAQAVPPAMPALSALTNPAGVPVQPSPYPLRDPPFPPQ